MMRFGDRLGWALSGISLLALADCATAQPAPGPDPSATPPETRRPAVDAPPSSDSGGSGSPAAGGPALLHTGASDEAPAQIDIPQVTVEGRAPRRRPQAMRGEPAAAPVQRRPAVPDLAPSAAATSPSSIDGSDLRRDTGSDFGGAFHARPGATAAGLSTQSARPVLRGLSDAMVRIQENGVGTTDVSDIAQDHGVPIDPLSVQQTTVIRGPGALRFGSQAVGGVVEASNNRIPSAAPPGGVTAESRVGGTSGINGWESGLILDAGGRDVAVHADVYGRQGGDYRIPRYPYPVSAPLGSVVRGRQPNSSFSAEGAAVGGSYLFESGYAGIAVSRFTSDYHVPGIATAADRQHNDLQQTRLTSKGEIRPDLPSVGAIRYWLGHSEYRHDETARTARGTQSIGATFRNTQEEGRAELETTPFVTPLGILKATFGAQGSSQKLNTRGQAILKPALTQMAAGYLFVETKHADAFRTQLAGRIESVALRGTSFGFPSNSLPPPGEPTTVRADRGYTPTSVSLGATHDLPFSLVAGVTAQRIERAPRALELFAAGADDSEKTFKIGNANLKIEVANTIEGGISRVGGDLRFDARAYYTRYENFIYGGATGNFCLDSFATCGRGVPSDYIQVAYGQRDATFRGAELSGQWLMLPVGRGTLGIDGQFDVVKATFADGSNVPRIPPMRIGGGVFWRDGEWSLRLGLIHALAQNDYATFDTRTPSFDVLKLEIERKAFWHGSPAGPVEVTTGLIADNLLDAPIRNAIQFHKDEILLPGRTFKGYLTFRYGGGDAMTGARRTWALLDDGRDEAPDRTDWSGAYAGIHAGGAGRGVTSDVSVTNAVTDASLDGGRRATRHAGPIGGGQIGYNWVLRPLVAGIEADVQSSGPDRKLTRACAADGCRAAPAVPGAAITSGAARGVFGTVRGRAGVLITSDIMAYVTVGVPIASVVKAGTASVTGAGGLPSTGSFANGPVKVGWTVGGGIETRLRGDWSARLEYLHHDFGTSASIPVASANSAAAVGYASRLREDVVRVGLNTRFDVGRLFGR